MRDYREIWFFDSEFIANPGERPDPVALCARELKTERTVTLFGDELPSTPPYPLDDDVLFVAFTAAELEFHLAVGWPLPRNFLDLRVEHICQTNVAEKRPSGAKQPKPPRALIDVLRSYGITDGDAAVKEKMRARIMRGWPFDREEREAILRYCLTDAEVLEPLFYKLLPGIRKL